MSKKESGIPIQQIKMAAACIEPESVLGDGGTFVSGTTRKAITAQTKMP